RSFYTSGDCRHDLIVLKSDTLTQNENATTVGASVAAFGASVDRPTFVATGTQDVFVADLDGDGRPEVGVVGGNQLWIYKNQSTTPAQPSYEAARVLALDRTASAVIAADLEGRGQVDLMLASTDGTFTAFSLLFN